MDINHAIATLSDPTKDALIIDNAELIGWLKELQEAREDMCDALDLLEKANKDIAEQAGMFAKCRSCVYVECMSDGTHELHRCTHDQECWCGEYYKWRYADAVNKLLSKHADKENEHER